MQSRHRSDKYVDAARRGRRVRHRIRVVSFGRRRRDRRRVQVRDRVFEDVSLYSILSIIIVVVE